MGEGFGRGGDDDVLREQPLERRTRQRHEPPVDTRERQLLVAKQRSIRNAIREKNLHA